MRLIEAQLVRRHNKAKSFHYCAHMGFFDQYPPLVQVGTRRSQPFLSDLQLPLGLLVLCSLRTVEGLVDLSFAILLLLRDLDDLFCSICLGRVFTVGHESDEELCKAGGGDAYSGRWPLSGS